MSEDWRGSGVLILQGSAGAAAPTSRSALLGPGSEWMGERLEGRGGGGVVGEKRERSKTGESVSSGKHRTQSTRHTVSNCRWLLPAKGSRMDCNGRCSAEEMERTPSPFGGFGTWTPGRNPRTEGATSGTCPFSSTEVGLAGVEAVRVGFGFGP